MTDFADPQYIQSKPICAGSQAISACQTAEQGSKMCVAYLDHAEALRVFAILQASWDARVIEHIEYFNLILQLLQLLPGCDLLHLQCFHD